MNGVLARLFGQEWRNVRYIVIEGTEMYMAYDILKLLGLSNITNALRGVTGSYNVSPRYRTKEKVDDWNRFRSIHLVTIDGVFQMILNNKSPECKRIKEYIASQVLPSSEGKFKYRSAA
jgi:prophage antirepressor-like protein